MHWVKKNIYSVQESMDDKNQVPMFIQHSMVCNLLHFCILSCCSFHKLTIKLNSAHLCPIPTDPFITSDRGEREGETKQKRKRLEENRGVRRGYARYMNKR